MVAKYATLTLRLADDAATHTMNRGARGGYGSLAPKRRTTESGRK